MVDEIDLKILNFLQNDGRETASNIAKKLDNINEIKSWDISYYTEKLKQNIYNFDENDLKPYFQSKEVMKGAFKVAEKLYGLNFKILNLFIFSFRFFLSFRFILSFRLLYSFSSFLPSA